MNHPAIHLGEQELDEGSGMAEIGLLSVAVTHDLYNAVAATLAFANIALNNGPALTPQRKDDLQNIRQAAERGTRILDNFAALAKKGRLPLASCDIHEFIRAMFQSPHAFNRNDIQLKLELDREAPVVMANGGYLRRLLSTLIETAIGRTKGGGVLIFKTELIGREQNTTCMVRITVEDFGSRISDAILAKTFKPLTAVGASEDSAGMKLYLCSAIAMQHGGRFSVENKPERGAKFLLYLPVLVLK